MAKGVFITRPQSHYDDLPEVRYHFPHTYLQTAEQTVGDWILYYEPRRNGGRQVYFATARVTHIQPDQLREKHYYAYLHDYLELAQPVPFREGNTYYESALRRPDGRVNLGLFQRAIHLLPEDEYTAILKHGMVAVVDEGKLIAETAGLSEEPQEDYQRPKTAHLITRPKRDQAFRHIIRAAYHSSCAMTGLNLINGEGHSEIEAVHIRPVEHDGPDSTRNGLALSRTIHWMFDRGLLSLGDDGRILSVDRLTPQPVKYMLNADGFACLPRDTALRPHPHFLRYHRDHIFKG